MTNQPKPRVRKIRGGTFAGFWVVEHGMILDPCRTWDRAIAKAIKLRASQAAHRSGAVAR
jgi:hypothetical protein